MTDVSTLRAARAMARNDVGVAAARLAAQRNATGPDSAAYQQALAALRQARAAESDLRDQLSTASAALPTDGIAQLDARYPVAFLPVRVETRFNRLPLNNTPVAAGSPGGDLMVRIYPDSIMADSHEPLLTSIEVNAGQAYWQQTFTDGHEQDAWTALLNVATPERAAWIVVSTTPTNVDGHTAQTMPMFPAVDTRPVNWHRVPEARGLPDRWIVSLFRGDTRSYQVVSEPVREGLALTLRLSGDSEHGGVDQTVDLSGDGLSVEPELRWAYDFDEALAAGMAVKIPLTVLDMAQGFSTLLVVGVRTGETAEDQAAQLDELLTAHRYTRGLAFIAQGTPTNNTSEAPSAYPVNDPGGTVSFPIARGSALAGTGTDGARFATALGLPATVVDHVAGAGRDEQTRAQAMVRALWPATIGYFLDQLLAPEVSTATAEAVREFMSGWVRPRGPLPAVRVGAVPYGVLPVSAWSQWAARPSEDAPVGLSDLLVRIANSAAAHTASAARVGGSTDPDADLIGVLGMDASARSVRIRRSFGSDTTWNIYGYTGRDRSALDQSQQQIGQGILATLGHAGRDPRALHLSFLALSHDFGGPMVAADPLSETEALAFDYIAWLAASGPGPLRSQRAPPTPVNALLYLMLRQGLLAEYDVAARRLLTVRGMLLPYESREAELVGILPQQVLGRAQVPAVRTAWERFDLRIAGATGDRTVGEFLADPAPPAGGGLEDLVDYRDALTKLSGVPSAELDRLFTETLDACSHRVDAWLTGLATRRLAALREAAPIEANPDATTVLAPEPTGPDLTGATTTGVYLGCYGWVVDLHADPTSPTVNAVAPDGSTVAARIDSDGYVYAPSMLHAAAAAVLRSGYLARSGAAKQPYAIDLSSSRVRIALAVLDAVRDTQPLGAVLGYAFERGLHDHYPGVELDRFIDVFRGLYPAVANKAEDSTKPADVVAARTVVDGLALLHAWQNGLIPASALATATSTEQDAVNTEFRSLDDTVDAVSDLLLSESVFQVIKGSPAGAAATLDTLARGQRPPEPEVVATPRGGTVLYQRVALALGDGTPAPGWSVVPATPRASAAPELDGWLGGLIGDPAGIACLIKAPDGSTSQVTLAQLGLRPVDLLVIVQEAQATGAQSELDLRIGRLVAVPGTVDYDDPGTGTTSISVACEVLAAAAKVIGHGRALTAADLRPPTNSPPAAAASPILQARATAARQALTQTRIALNDPAALRTALDRAALFDAPQASTATDGAEVGQLLDARLAAAGTAETPEAALAAIFGTGLPIVAPFDGVPADVLGVEPGLGADPDGTVEGWLAQVGRVQPAVDAWLDVQIYGRALGRDVPRPRIAQLPAGAATWAGLGYGTEADRPRSGQVSLAIVGSPPLTGSQAWLMLAEWPEIIPAVEEEAGAAVQFDAPGAQAPQAVLLAVPPDAQPNWSYAALERTLLDTLRLAEIRALDLSQLGDFGQLTPMTFLAENTAGATISTTFAGLLVADATLGATQ